MSIGAGDILSGIQFLSSVVSKVKDNRQELRRVSTRLEYIYLSLEECRRKNVIRSEEYTDALTVVADLVERAQRATQRLLKRSIGDRTWKRDEIAKEINRICNDVDAHLNTHMIRTLDAMHNSNTESFAGISATVEDIMVKLAEIDIRLDTPRLPDGPAWSPAIQRAAQKNVNWPSTEAPHIDTSILDIKPSVEVGQSIAMASTTDVDVSCLYTMDGGSTGDPVRITGLNPRSTKADLMNAIESAGYRRPPSLVRDPIVMTVGSADRFDASAPGGLQIYRGTPLGSWWNKFRAFHGMAHATTPGHTIVKLHDSSNVLTATGVNFAFHRTLRVPDNLEPNRLPASFGHFPIIPVSRLAHRLPENIRSRGGFIVPMYEREALFISFSCEKPDDSPAIKVSVGGVNILTGIHKSLHDASLRSQDYLTPKLQPWIDGCVTREGVVRQFVAMSHGKGYSVEEQVTGMAEEGGFQFDIFPRRQIPPVRFYEFNMQFKTPHGRIVGGKRLRIDQTPNDADVEDGAMLGVWEFRNFHDWANELDWPFPFPKNAGGYWPKELEKDWHISDQYRLTGTMHFEAIYYQSVVGFSGTHRPPPEPPGQLLSSPQASSHFASLKVESMGVAVGGQIEQKIYRDPRPPYIYAEEESYRFHVHIISPEMWETTTGVLPPLTPITPATYQVNQLPWFKLDDEEEDTVFSDSQILKEVKSVSQIDRENRQLESEIDPESPPPCILHHRLISSVVFRPCSHPACTQCLGAAMLKNSRCPHCGATVEQFVGMKEPVAHVVKSESETGNDDDEGQAWDVKGIETLSQLAAKSGNVVVIHLEKDQVSHLHQSDIATASDEGMTPKQIKALSDLGVKRKSTNSFAPAEPSERKVKLFVSHTGVPGIALAEKFNLCKYDVVEIDLSDTVGSLKLAIEEKIGVTCDRQRILYKGRLLGYHSDSEILRDYGISEECTLILANKLLPRTE